jgi:hypothetical protein
MYIHDPESQMKEHHLCPKRHELSRRKVSHEVSLLVGNDMDYHSMDEHLVMGTGIFSYVLCIQNTRERLTKRRTGTLHMLAN